MLIHPRLTALIRTKWTAPPNTSSMGLFWGAASQVAAKFDGLKAAESALLDLAEARHLRETAVHQQQHQVVVDATDTQIPAFSSPSSGWWYQRWFSKSVEDDTNSLPKEHYTIHSLTVTQKGNSTAATVKERDKPLVLLHGYANGGAYFYRNLFGLSQYFSKIHALDLLGWGLSSRPDFRALVHNNQDAADTVDAAQDFFVESLEAWRKHHKIDSMILAGHSMGGYLSVAYTERYPQHVDRLILLSPVGVVQDTVEMEAELRSRYLSTWKSRCFFGLYEFLFPRYTPGDLLRAMPTTSSRNRVEQYVTRRLPAISEPREQAALAEYLYLNNVLPGSGEYCLSKLLKPSVFGHRPLQNRIPSLQIASCTFLYGEHDWMDQTGGLLVQEACRRAAATSSSKIPEVAVYQVRNAGHLLMLENSREFNHGVVLGAGLASALDPETKSQWPARLTP